MFINSCRCFNKNINGKIIPTNISYITYEPDKNSVSIKYIEDAYIYSDSLNTELNCLIFSYNNEYYYLNNEFDYISQYCEIKNNILIGRYVIEDRVITPLDNEDDINKEYFRVNDDLVLHSITDSYNGCIQFFKYNSRILIPEYTFNVLSHDISNVYELNEYFSEVLSKEANIEPTTWYSVSVYFELKDINGYHITDMVREPKVLNLDKTMMDFITK